MDEIKQMAKTVAQCIKGDSKKTKGYDTAATVKRVDGGTLYVSIPGGVPETPVKKTIDAKVGDTVQVHVGNGTAWLTGNRTAPPTDDAEALVAKAVAKVADKTANKAKTTAEQAETTANAVSGIANNALTQAQQAKQIADDTEQHFWFQETGADTGAHITEVTQEEWNDVSDPNYHSGGNFLGRSNGIALREGMLELATLQQSGLDVNTYDGGGNAVNIAHLGYGAGTNDSGGTSNAPYYDIGVRLSGSTKGNYSTVEGHDNTASGYDSHAEGGVNIASGTDSHCEGARNTASGHYSHCEGVLNTASGVNSHCEGYQSEASGNFSHAGGEQTIAGYDHQTVIGKYNDNKSGNLFEIGNGTGNFARANAFEVSNNGILSCKDENSNFNTIFKLIYPVGSIYMSVNNTDPGTIFGGSWQRITGRFLLAATDGGSSGASQAAGNTGGSADAIIPYHRHSVDSVSIGASGAHTHDAGNNQAFLRYNQGTVSTGVQERSVASGASGNYKAPVVNNANTDWSYLDKTSSETHTHTVPSHNTNYAGTSGNATGANMPPYLSVYVWKRTA